MLSLLVGTGRATVSSGSGRLVPVSLTGLSLGVLLATHLDVGPRMHEVALFLHLGAVVAGFGAVLSIDWVGLSWVRGRTPLLDVLTTVTRLTRLVWVGLWGLVVTGVFLSPDPGSPRTLLKLGLVGLLICNGHHSRHLHEQLLDVTGSPPRRLVVRSLGSAAVSQLCWWATSLIGFLNARA